MTDEKEERPKEEAPPLLWMPWLVPPHMRAGMPGGDADGGGWCVTLGVPNERMRVGRQIGGVPTLSQDEANVIAARMNEIKAK